jgi:hypothetical protein
METEGSLRVRKIARLVRILSQIIPVHKLYLRLRSILILACQVCLGLPNNLIPSGFTIKMLYVLLFTPMHATYPVQRIVLDLVVIISLAKSTNYEIPYYDL